jgi:hypothetical protein
MRKIWIAVAVVSLIAAGLWGFRQTQVTPEVRATLQAAIESFDAGGGVSSVTETELASAAAAARTVEDRRLLARFYGVLAEKRALDANDLVFPDTAAGRAGLQENRRKMNEMHSDLAELSREVGVTLPVAPQR